MHPHVTTARPIRFTQITALSTALALAGLTGCSSVAPSKTTSGATTGAVVGGLGGLAVGNNTSMGSGTGAAAVAKPASSVVRLVIVKLVILVTALSFCSLMIWAVPLCLHGHQLDGASPAAALAIIFLTGLSLMA